VIVVWGLKSVGVCRWGLRWDKDACTGLQSCWDQTMESYDKCLDMQRYAEICRDMQRRNIRVRELQKYLSAAEENMPQRHSLYRLVTDSGKAGKLIEYGPARRQFHSRPSEVRTATIPAPHRKPPRKPLSPQSIIRYSGKLFILRIPTGVRPKSPFSSENMRYCSASIINSVDRCPNNINLPSQA